jgi:pimeloyl-ACP methyl ester carboxylesterase
MTVLDVDGDKLHFVDEGAGAPVVFVHGSCGGARQWKGLASALCDDYRTICIDLFGSGQSESWPIERQWRVDYDGRAINAVFDLLAEPVHLVIHSGGGQFAYPVIRDRPDRILTITLFEPIYFHLLRHDGDALFEEPQAMSVRYRNAVDAGDLEDAIRDFVDKWIGAGGWNAFPESTRAMMRSGAGRLYYEWLTPWLEAPSRDDLRAQAIPALLIKGSQTLASMHRVCDIVAQSLPDCRYHTIDGAGHMSPFTHVRQVEPLVRRHLAGNVSGDET